MKRENLDPDKLADAMDIKAEQDTAATTTTTSTWRNTGIDLVPPDKYEIRGG